MEREQEEGVSHASGAAAARSGLAVAFFLKEILKIILKNFRRVLWEK